MPTNNQCVIPEPVSSDPDSREILRAWIAHRGLHVSLFIPDGWQDPAAWGIALTDVARHLADAYHQTHGLAPGETIRRIQEGMTVELSAPTGQPTGGFVERDSNDTVA